MPIRKAHLVASARNFVRGFSLVLVASLGLGALPAGSAAEAQSAPGDWDSAIDATWGPGLPTERKLEIFDAFWRTMDERFAAFQGLDVDWAALRERYRPQIAAGVSRGRFAAIMSHLALALREQHTVAFDLPVLQTPRRPGVPIMVLRGPHINNTFGACATAQEDGSALIYNVAPGHPLGIAPGDRILGYDGRPWPELYRELLAAELPTAGAWGSSPTSFEHTLVQSAPVNWHLFDTIDVLKQATGTIEHLSTAALNTTPPLRSPLCSEQLAVPGVPKPAALSDLVTWGLIEGTGIGYIYVTGWAGDAGDRFALAIDELTQKRETDGLIIDFRHARGGNMFLSDADHYKMQPYVGEEIEYCGIRWLGFSPSLYVIDMCDRAFDPRSYDRPIAVLTGPRAASAGDQVALRMTFHPRARTFGKTTNTSFNAPCPLDLDPDWSLQYACADAYRIDQPHNYLTHDESVVDEPVWLQPDDVAQGRDTVVDAAIRWIGSQTASGE